MSYLTMGDFAGTAQDDYIECRKKYPADMQGPAALTYADPCWQALVGMRRAEGRDPFGRDLWGPGGAPPPSTVSPTLSARQRELGAEEVKPQAVMIVGPSVDSWGYPSQYLQDRLSSTYGMPAGSPTVNQILTRRRDEDKAPPPLSIRRREEEKPDNKLMYLAAGGAAVLLIGGLFLKAVK